MKAKPTKLKGKYLPAYVDDFEARREAHCLVCSYGIHNPCPLRGTEVCVRLVGEPADVRERPIERVYSASDEE